MESAVRHEASVQVVVELGNTNVRVMSVTPDGWAAPTSRVLDADGRMPARLTAGADGSWVWGGERVRGQTVVGGFLARVDDPVPLVLWDVPVPAADVVARQLREAVSLVAAERGRPCLLTVIHPDGMSLDGCRRIEAAFGTDVPLRWRSRAATSVDAARGRGEVVVGDLVASLHVGGASCVATVWSVTPSPRRLALVRGDRSWAGDAIDDLVVAHVRRGAGAETDADPAGLRMACEAAKTTLSTRTWTDVEVGTARVRLVRSELEEVSAPLLTRQLDTLAHALRVAGVEPTTLRTVLLTGGGASAPSVVEAVGARFATPARTVGRLASTVAHDLTVVVTPAAARHAPVRPSRPRHLARPAWAFSGPWSSPRGPVFVVASALVAALVVGGAAVQQAGVVGMLAAALGSDGSAASARTLAAGVAAPWMAILPEVPDTIVDAIEGAADTMTDADADADVVTGERGQVTPSPRGSIAGDPVRVPPPPGTTGTSPTTPATGPSATAKPDPSTAPDPTPDPSQEPDPEPTTEPEPTTDPTPAPTGSPAPDPDPDPTAPVDSPVDSDEAQGGSPQ